MYQARRMGSSCSKDPTPRWLSGKGFQRHCMVHDQLVLSSWTGWHQGEVSHIIILLAPTSLGSLCLGLAVFIWWGSGFCKNNLGMCVRPLYLSGNWEFSDSAMWLIYSLNCYHFSGPASLLCFYMLTFPNN